MRGTPYIYFGDELGMTNIDMPSIEDYVDIQALGEYETARLNGDDLEVFMKSLNYNSRENSRTPLQWDNSVNAGFSTAEPWKRVNPNYTEINVKQQLEDPNSVLNHFKKMTQIRKENKVLTYGTYTIIDEEHPNIYAYTRSDSTTTKTVLLNFSSEPSSIEIKGISSSAKPIINNYNNLQIEENTVILQPYQAVIF